MCWQESARVLGEFRRNQEMIFVLSYVNHSDVCMLVVLYLECYNHGGPFWLTQLFKINLGSSFAICLYVFFWTNIFHTVRYFLLVPWACLPLCHVPSISCAPSLVLLCLKCWSSNIWHCIIQCFNSSSWCFS